jgi:chromosome partitioning protein
MAAKHKKESIVARVIAVANQKGGVGKTTTATNLAASLGASKQPVLLIDLDPQGNATVGSGLDAKRLSATIKDVILGDEPLRKALYTTKWCYDILPGNGDLTVAEVRLLGMEQRERRLDLILQDIKKQYAYILIDCPPSLNMLTLNALVAADSVLVPIQCEYYALEGLTSLLGTIDQVRKTANPKLKLEGLLRTMYDGRNRLTQEVSNQLLSHFGETVYQTVIPRNVRLAEAPSHGCPILSYDPHSQGSLAYLALASEIIRCQAVPA